MNALNLTSNNNQMDPHHHHPQQHQLHHPHLQSQNLTTPNNSNHPAGQRTGSGKFSNDSECSSVTSDSMPGGSGKSHSGTNQQNLVYFNSIFSELQERREDCIKLKERLEVLMCAFVEFSAHFRY